MFILYGRRTVCIKMETDNHQVCNSCESVGVDVLVYREYFHIFFLPIAPSGPKNAIIQCSQCRESKWYKDARKLYEQVTRTPVYFYSGLIIVATLLILLVPVIINTKNNKDTYVANPIVGDVYTITKEENDTTYCYFLRVSQIKGDSIWAYHNNLEYIGYANQFNNFDYFLSSEEIGFSKKGLQQMFDKGTIYAVYRTYGSATGFDRVKKY
jgi:hypothetical protein